MRIFSLLLLILSSAPIAKAERPSSIARVYAYRCEATFLEGEGATAGGLSCPPFQQLGVLRAWYTHYISDPAQQSGDSLYPETACNLELIQTQCTSSLPELKFGLAARAEGKFSVPVQLSPGPGQAPALLGYAAETTSGKCEAGLELAQAYRAVPKSVTRPLPSSFVNLNGSLNDVIVASPVKKALRFELQRFRNTISCDEVGDCRGAQFDEAVGFQRVDYQAGGKAICVVPKSAL